MKTTIFNFLLAGFFISSVSLTSCSKNDNIKDLNNNAQQIANSNSQNIAARPSGMEPVDAGILNQDLKIISASDNGTDITQQFNFYTFRFVGNYPGGEAQVWNDLLAQIGAWSAPGPNST
ncbi:MAG: hypothetical protein ABIN74_07785, partial [Ferruginibacter sp.]